MGTLRRTYSLPAKAVKQFEKAVPVRERSQVLAGLIQAWLEQERKKKLREEMIAGCREMADINLELEREFHPLEEEVHRRVSFS